MAPKTRSASWRTADIHTPSQQWPDRNNVMGPCSTLTLRTSSVHCTAVARLETLAEYRHSILPGLPPHDKQLLLYNTTPCMSCLHVRCEHIRVPNLEIWPVSFIPAALVPAAIPAAILIPAAKTPITRLLEQVSGTLRAHVLVIILAEARHCLLAGCCILHSQGVD